MDSENERDARERKEEVIKYIISSNWDIKNKKFIDGKNESQIAQLLSVDIIDIHRIRFNLFGFSSEELEKKLLDIREKKEINKRGFGFADQIIRKGIEDAASDLFDRKEEIEENLAILLELVGNISLGLNYGEYSRENYLGGKDQGQIGKINDEIKDYLDILLNLTEKIEELRE